MSKRNIGKRNSAYEKLIVELYRLKWDDPNLEFNDILRTMYVDQQMSMADMAEEMNVAAGTVHNWLKKEGITSRKMIWI